MGFHRIDQLDHELMDQFASGAFKCPDVKARAARGDACQLRRRLALGAKWSLNGHGCSPWIRRERNTLSHRVDAEGGR